MQLCHKADKHIVTSKISSNNLQAEKLEEKLHRRTTVRMGIRVVQRAAAPPSPLFFNPSGTIPNLSKQQRNKNGHKILLFACKSVPLQSNFDKDENLHYRQTSPKSELKNSKLNIKNELSLCDEDEDRDNGNSCKQISKTDERQRTSISASEAENKSFQEIITSRTPTHVSFKDQVRNGSKEVECHTSRVDDLASYIDKKESGDGEISMAEDTNKQSQLERFEAPCGGKRPSLAAFLAQVPPPHATVEKPFLLSDGRVELEASLDKGIYSHGEEIEITVQVRNFSSKTVKRIKVFIVQHVDVCMFSNGKFKNVVAAAIDKGDCPITSGSILTKTYNLTPTKSTTKNWIALEDSYTKTGTSLASTVTNSCESAQDRNVFAIYVTYYVKVKLIVSVMGGEVSLKLPFTLMHTCNEFDPTWTKDLESPRGEIHQRSTPDEIKTDIDET
ncbi:hypothetical protein FQA39_LY08396 [Lamprigera yunnana]|nr:hypothetical protein FQA39_LY08396 [Lamprigera yunnana]